MIVPLKRKKKKKKGMFFFTLGTDTEISKLARSGLYSIKKSCIVLKGFSSRFN